MPANPNSCLFVCIRGSRILSEANGHENVERVFSARQNALTSAPANPRDA